MWSRIAVLVAPGLSGFAPLVLPPGTLGPPGPTLSPQTPLLKVLIAGPSVLSPKLLRACANPECPVPSLAPGAGTCLVEGAGLPIQVRTHEKGNWFGPGSAPDEEVLPKSMEALNLQTPRRERHRRETPGNVPPRARSTCRQWLTHPFHPRTLTLLLCKEFVWLLGGVEFQEMGWESWAGLDVTGSLSLAKELGSVPRAEKE